MPDVIAGLFQFLLSVRPRLYGLETRHATSVQRNCNPVLRLHGVINISPTDFRIPNVSCHKSTLYHTILINGGLRVKPAMTFVGYQGIAGQARNDGKIVPQKSVSQQKKSDNQNDYPIS